MIATTDRLAQIRAQAAQWVAIEPSAKNWDSVFLLGVIDDLVAQLRSK